MIKHSRQVIFWILIFVFLNIIFGWKWKNYLDSFYFTSMLMPIAVVTSYFFNLFLVPKYLQKGRTVQFALYTLYTIIVSLFLSAVITVLAFVFLSDLKWNEMNPIVGDLFQMGIIIYFVAILFSFIHLYQSNIRSTEQISKLEIANRKNLQNTIVVRSNRENITIAIEDILYIESLADYVKIIGPSSTIITKEKISALEKRLPTQFIRCHRSFLINQHKIEAFGYDFVKVKSERLPIGRKYKHEALAKINASPIDL